MGDKVSDGGCDGSTSCFGGQQQQGVPAATGELAKMFVRLDCELRQLS